MRPFKRVERTLDVAVMGAAALFIADAALGSGYMSNLAGAVIFGWIVRLVLDCACYVGDDWLRRGPRLAGGDRA